MTGPGADGAADDVHLFVTCLVDQFRPEAGVAAAACLRDAGCRVRFDPRQTCCGQPALNLGHRDEARAVARQVLDLYRDTEGPIVVPSGSCATTMAKLYPTLFAGTPEATEAERLAGRVVEWSRFLHVRGYRPQAERAVPAVTVHPSCHGLRELGLRDEAHQLLQQAQVPLVDLPAADECCGFGGAFSVVMPEMSGAILRTKLDNVEAALHDGARTVVSLDVGCLMHLQGGHERRRDCSAGAAGCPFYRHVAEVVADAAGLRPEDP